MAMVLKVMLVVLALGLSGCRSLGSHTPEAGAVPEPAAPASGAALTDAAQSSAVSCDRAPAAATCCEAFVPMCNECRAQQEQHIAAWRQHCLPPSVAVKGCGGSPPVVTCCAEPTDDCRVCREAALNELLAWKTACADEDAPACDRQPPQSTCCQALTPSCQGCQERNRRVLDSWERRCANAAVTVPMGVTEAPVLPGPAPETPAPSAAE